MLLKLTALTIIASATSIVELDPDLHPYEPTTGVSGTVTSMGSDTMNNLMTAWGDEFARFYPAVKVEVQGKGSSTAPTALIEGQALFGPMSRRMKPSESDKFLERFGYEPELLRTGVDCLAVFVHRDCPIDELSLEQVEQVFSVTGPDMRWRDLGVTDPAWANRPIALYGRNSASGTYGYFKDLGLGGNDFKASVKEQPGSSAVVQAIAEDQYSMGYSGIGYRSPGVKALRLSVDGDESFEPSGENAYTGDYPLARFLYVYINHDPREELDPLRAEFIRVIYSREGQDAVLKYGYYPLSAELADGELERLGLLQES
ncbi:MAG: phosphate ABC transporter substrate-binding protein [Planctomycetota bacterium]